jgi:CRP/FNR family cyclic AMP-dependent transcriptional regulator
MNSTDLLKSLAAHPFFHGLSDVAFQQVANFAGVQEFAAGSLLVQESRPASSFILIQSGRASIEIHSPRRGSIPIQSIGPGEVIGWSWLVPPHEWHFDARALEPVRAIVLDGSGLRQLCQVNHEIGSQVYQRLLGVLAGRLSATRLQLLDESK